MTDSRIAYLLPPDEIEATAQKQIEDVLKHDFVKRVAIMPDVHAGMSLPIGGVVLTQDFVSPSWVGVDQHCGVLVAETDLYLTEELERDLGHIYGDIMGSIPVGFRSRLDGLYSRAIKFVSADPNMPGTLQKHIQDKLDTQMGTLGSGNHFLALSVDDENRIHVEVHSGSRNVGKSLADYYCELADKSGIDGCVHHGSDEAVHFLSDLHYSHEFAHMNRRTMLYEVMRVLGTWMERRVSYSVLADASHNHVIPVPNGMWLHRKGAICAEEGFIAAIPGNMRDGTYIVRGYGNEKYLSSASHGAGRVQSRTKAKELCDMEQFREDMQGIVANVSESTRDENPRAYKDFYKVIAYQNGVVFDTVKKLTPILNIKG